MKLSRTDFVPLLTIMAGGVLGASLSFGFLGQSPAEDVPGVLLGILYESPATPELAVRVEHPNVTAARIEADWMVISPVVASYERATPDARRQALFRASQLARDRQEFNRADLLAEALSVVLDSVGPLLLDSAWDHVPLTKVYFDVEYSANIMASRREGERIPISDLTSGVALAMERGSDRTWEFGAGSTVIECKVETRCIMDPNTLVIAAGILETHDDGRVSIYVSTKQQVTEDFIYPGLQRVWFSLQRGSWVVSDYERFQR